MNKIKFEASYEDLTLKKITLELTTASSTLWGTTSDNVATSVAANIERVYLYDGDTLLNSGGTPVANGRASITGLNVTLPADSIKVLTVKADITGSGTLASKSVGGIKVYPVSTDYLVVNSSTGLMTSGITLTTTTDEATSYAQSYNFLFTDTAPSVAAVSGWDGQRSGSPALREMIAKYTISNPGTRTLTLDELILVASLANVSATTTSRVTNFELYDSSDTLIATSTLYSDSDLSTTTTQLDGVTSTVYVKFDLTTYGSTKQIAPGGSETFVVKANTLNVEAGESNSGQVSVRLSTYIGGSKGYDSDDTLESPSGEELYWGDSYIVYKYTPSGGNELSELRACDDVPVYGATLSY